MCFIQQIVLGGGRQVFEAAQDNGTTKWPCKRGDNLDLIGAWRADKDRRTKTSAFVRNRQDLLGVDLSRTDFILGLFDANHIPYEVDRSNDLQSAPGIVEMTETAIKFLQKSKQGFFLLVEGGRIDHAHHKNQALRALEEAVAMDQAVQLALKMTDAADTMVVVTADHSHTFNINGYPARGNAITGIAGGNTADNGYNYTTLSYSTGPGFWANINDDTPNITSPWHDPTTLDIHSKDYMQLSHTPAGDASHGGEDVAVYASGPMAHLVHGVHEQSFVAHAMGYAACIGPYSSQCHQQQQQSVKTNGAPEANFLPSAFLLVATVFLIA